MPGGQKRGLTTRLCLFRFDHRDDNLMSTTEGRYQSVRLGVQSTPKGTDPADRGCGHSHLTETTMKGDERGYNDDS